MIKPKFTVLENEGTDTELEEMNTDTEELINSGLNLTEDEQSIPKVRLDGIDMPSDVDLSSPIILKASYRNIFDKNFKDGRYALILLFLVNLFNYCDRYAPSAIKDYIKEDLQLSDTQTGLPSTVFLIVYVICSPIFATLTDNGYDPRRLITIGVVLFSISCFCGAFATNLYIFLLTRSFVGIGEAAYATIGPVLLTSFYPTDFHSRVLSIFYIAIPVGASIGYELAGAIALEYGWRMVFIAISIPGIILGFLCLSLKWPDKDYKREEVASWKATLIYLFTTPSFVLSQFGCAFTEFATGSLGDWIVSYIHRTMKYSIETVSMMVGLTALCGGIIGTISGSWWAEFLKSKIHNRYFFVCFTSNFTSCFIILMILFKSENSFTLLSAMCFLAQISMWQYTGPSNVIISNTIPIEMRTRAYAISIMMIHSCGDAISPTITGYISDNYGLLYGMLLIPSGFFISGILYSIPWIWKRLYDEQTESFNDSHISIGNINS
jgi:predicted MFS family arabinose efflux permease